MDSTQEEAKRLYRNRELVNGTIIWAKEQSLGKGRHGRKWYSPKGKGIWFTYAFKTSLRGKELNLLNLAAALGVVDALEDLGLKAFLKWPNDVILSDKKVCGVLLEALFEGDNLAFCLLGIGLNLKDIDEVPGSTSLERELGGSLSEDFVFKKLVDSVVNSIGLVEKEKEVVLSRYRNLCLTLGKEVSFKRNGTLLKGKAIELSSDGGLIVDVNGRIEVLYAELVEDVR
ncbi:MAG: BirA family transcriptional regulator [bacterium]|nr:BirA family transcriptional regulator [bacterium]